MTDKKNLYFIAILPDLVTSQRVADIKEVLYQKYGLSYAQRLPAHISVQSPFHATSSQEAVFNDILKSLANNWKPFTLKVCDYKQKSDNVFYLEICHSEALVEFQEEVLKNLEEKAEIPITLLSIEFNPHITLAYRDVSDEVLEKIWSEYSKKKFNAEFEVHHVVIFKHDGDEWGLLNAIKLK